MNKYDYIHLTDIPIFDEDEQYDYNKLAEIVATNNARVADTGDTCPLIFGHTTDATPETEQPPVVGYADNYKLGTIGNLNPRACILADFHIDEKYEEEAKEYKNRSVELWTEDCIFHPIALLKTSRPAKNLGVMSFSVENKNKLRKYMNEEENDMSPEQVQKLVIDTINSSEWAAAVKSMIESQAKASQEEASVGEPLSTEPDAEEEATEEGLVAADAEAEGKEHPELSDEEVKQVAEDHVEEVEDKPDGDEVEKNDATPSGTNTFVPEIGNKKKEEDEDEEKKKKMALDAHVEKYKIELETQKAVADKYAQEFKKILEERNDAIGKLIIANRNNELLKLSYEFNFNPDEEIKLVSNMDDATFEQHKNIIKSRYNKVPINRGFVNPVAEIKDQKLTSEKVLEIVRYASKNNKTFEQARSEVMNG